MASYASVMWQTDDEITSEKLQQMASNDDYLNQFTVQSTRFNNFATDPNFGNALTTNLRGRVYGTTNNTKRVTVYAAFDYNNLATPVNDIWFNVNFPGVFTVAPVIVATVATGQPSHGPGIPPMVVGLGGDVWNDHCELMIRYSDNHSDKNWNGVVHLMAEGT